MDAVKHEKPQLGRSLSATSSSLQDGALQSSSRKEKVWVGVRIRPLLEQELLAKEQSAWRAEQDNSLLFLGGQDSLAAQQTAYQYNKVFPECSASEQVYADAASNLVAAAVNGYNGTIFAYGQTGSGKTYTMQAMMACAAREVFSLIAQDASREFIIRLAALEIYNENVRDLLQQKSPSVKLLDDPIKGTVADGLSEAGVSSEKQLRQLLDEVAARRQVGQHTQYKGSQNLSQGSCYVSRRVAYVRLLALTTRMLTVPTHRIASFTALQLLLANTNHSMHGRSHTRSLRLNMTCLRAVADACHSHERPQQPQPCHRALVH